MKISIPSLFLILLAALPLNVAAAEPEVVKVISPQTVRTQGMTRDEMVQTLSRLAIKATTVANDSVDGPALRKAIDTLETASNKARGQVFASQ